MAHDEMTIDELAQRAGITSRNVRAYQTKELLPPPRMVGRIGYYDEGHLARLRYIARLQERGFSLAAIHALLKAWEQGRGIGDVLGFEEALTAPWTDEVAETYGPDQLAELFPEAIADPRVLQRAIDLELLLPEGEDFKVPSPRLLHVGAELVAAGVPLEVVLDEYVQLVSDTERMARRFARLFDKYVWEPFAAAGLPADQLPQITESLRRLRPTASIAVHAALMQAMEQAVAASTADQVRKLIFGSTAEAS